MKLSFKQYLIEKLSDEELAKKLEVSVDDVQSLTPEELSTILKWVGEHDFTPDSEYDAKELAMGIEVEHEHTKNNIIAKLICKDHLAEPGAEHYYTDLKKMEKKEKEKIEKKDNN